MSDLDAVPSFLIPGMLAAALRRALPDADPTAINVLAELLADLAAGALSPEVAVARLAANPLRPLIVGLAGQELSAGGLRLDCAQSQAGVIRIGDLAGREWITLALSQAIADATYTVRGLPNPYRGFAPFSYADRDQFGGRGQLICTALDLLIAPDSPQAVLFITGVSGSGTSSLAMAGIVPALEDAYAAQNVPTRHALLRPGTQPLAALSAALDTLEWPQGGAFAAADPFRHTQPTPPSEAAPVGILVIDQAEELFYSEVDADQSAALIAILSDLPPVAELRLHIIVTLRADYLPDLCANPALSRIANSRLDLAAMDIAQLQDAIQRPALARYPDKRLEPALVARLAQDAAQDAARLPLLQVALEDLWRRGAMTLARYGGLDDALRDYIGAVIDYVDYDSDRQLLRGYTDRQSILPIFLDLIALGPDDDPRQDVRRRLTMDALCATDTTMGAPRQRLVRELCAARLLTTNVEQRDGGAVEVIEIIHACLISGWPPLSAAVAARRDFLQQCARFDRALAAWQQSGRADGDLLTGASLTEAESLYRHNPMLLARPEAAEFYHRSIGRRKREQPHQLPWKHVLAAALGVVALIALVAGGMTFELQHLARNQAAATEAAQSTAQARRSESNIQGLARTAEALPAEREEPALQLAYEAYASDKTNGDAAAALYHLVERRPWQVSQLEDPTGTIISAVFSPDGSRILTVSQDGTARLWDAQGQPLATVQGHTAAITSAAFSPDGTRILTTVKGGTAQLSDAQGQPLVTMQGEYRRPISGAFFSPDGRSILTLTSYNESKLWDTQGQALARLPYHSADINDTIRGVAFSSDSTHILTVSAERIVRLWDTHGQVLAIVNRPSAWVVSAVFSPDGTRILTAFGDGTAELWDMQGQVLATLRGHNEQLSSAVFSPDGTRILTASWDATARLWDAQGHPLATLRGHLAPLSGAVFSSDGTRILTASWDATARLWDAQGRPLALLQGHTRSIDRAILSSDGRHILTISNDTTARLWDWQPQPFAALLGNTASATRVVFASDGAHIVTTSEDGSIHQYVVRPDDLLAAAACRIGRELSADEIAQYNVPTPLHFHLADRHCQP